MWSVTPQHWLHWIYFCHWLRLILSVQIAHVTWLVVRHCLWGSVVYGNFDGRCLIFINSAQLISILLLNDHLLTADRLPLMVVLSQLCHFDDRNWPQEVADLIIFEVPDSKSMKSAVHCTQNNNNDNCHNNHHFGCAAVSSQRIPTCDCSISYLKEVLPSVLMRVYIF